MTWQRLLMMGWLSIRNYFPIFVFAILLFSPQGSANTLDVPSDSSWFIQFGASLLLYSHIGGGALGILSGIVASISKKGSVLHIRAGRVFFWSMSVCYLIGAVVSPFLDTQQSTNFVASILALYLLLSGVSAAQRRQFVAGGREKTGLVIAVLITGVGAVFMYLAAQSPDGSVDGSPPQAYVLFILAGSIGIIEEVRTIYLKKLTQNARIVRHLWRMSMSFFIASGSAFFGQAQFFPSWFNESLLPLLLGFFPLVVLLIYVAKHTIIVIKQTRKVARQ